MERTFKEELDWAKENEITECEKEIIKLKTQYINSNNTNNEEKIQEI